MQVGADVFTEFTEFTDGLAVRKILLGVQGRVEDRVEPSVQTNVEIAVFAGVALTFAVGIALLLARGFSRRRWIAGLATGAAWLLTWYLPAPAWLGAVLIFGGCFGLWRAHREPEAEHRRSAPGLRRGDE